jgi:hypothetical protein
MSISDNGNAYASKEVIAHKTIEQTHQLSHVFDINNTANRYKKIHKAKWNPGEDLIVSNKRYWAPSWVSRYAQLWKDYVLVQMKSFCTC